MDAEIISFGSGIARVLSQPGLRGRVHSVFKHTVNLKIADRLLSLQHSVLPKTPSMLLVEPGFVLGDFRLAVGDRVMVKEDNIVIKGHGFKLATARRWEGQLPVYFTGEEEVNFLGREVARALTLLDLPQLDFGLPGHSGQAVPWLEDLVVAGNGAGDAAMISALTSLIGLGPGLTPSGDDFLLGFLSVLSLLEKGNRPRSAFATALRRRIREGIQDTSPLSREFLFCACGGEYSEPFHELYKAAGRRDVMGLVQAVLCFTQIGHTSGTAALAGLLYGLDFCAKDTGRSGENDYPQCGEEELL
ncbi:MAG: DUF2877 domain-containing protein [Firmicutes bacterium]|nr:DUF2877 domain-containing protein [Bacillota bacterium]